MSVILGQVDIRQDPRQWILNQLLEQTNQSISLNQVSFSNPTAYSGVPYDRNTSVVITPLAGAGFTTPIEVLYNRFDISALSLITFNPGLLQTIYGSLAYINSACNIVLTQNDVSDGSLLDSNGNLAQTVPLISLSTSYMVIGDTTLTVSFVTGSSAVDTTNIGTIAATGGTVSDAAYTGTGPGTQIALLKGIYNNTVSGVGGSAESNYSLESGGNLATIASNTSGLGIGVTSLNTVTGTTSDVAYSGNGNGSLVSLLKAVYAKLNSTLNTRVLMSGTDSVTTVPSGTQSVSVTSLPLPSGAAQETGNLATVATNTGNAASSLTTVVSNTGTISTNTGNISTQSNTIATKATAIASVAGTTTDVAYSGSGAVSLISGLKGIYNTLNSTLNTRYLSNSTDSIAITASSLPLPTGAAQETGNLATIATNTGSISTNTSSIATSNSAISSASGTTSDLAYSGSGSTSIVGGLKGIYTAVKGSLNIRALTSSDVVTTVASGTTAITATSLPLPTGAAIEAGGNLSVINTNTGTAATNTTAISSATGTTSDTAWSGSGTSTSIAALKAIYNKVSGTLNTRALTSGTDSVTVVPSGTQAISASALPLPSNAAQETGGNLASINTSNTAISTATGTTADAVYSGSGSTTVVAALKGIYSGIKGSLNVRALTSSDVVTTVPSGTTAISAVSLPLPTGAALETGGNLASTATSVSGINSAIGTTGDTAWSGTGTSTSIAALKAIYNKLVTVNTRALTSSDVVTANIGTTNGLALDSSIQTLITTVKATLDLANTVWYDPTTTPPTYYVRRESMNEGTGVYTITWETPSGGAASPTVSNLVSVSDSQNIQSTSTVYTATAAATGYAIGDILVHSFGIDTGTSPASLAYSFWFNAGPSVNAGTTLASAPTNGNYALSTQGITAASLPLPSNAAQETGGNLASLVTSNSAMNTATGTTADSAYSGSGAASIISALKGIYAASVVATPTQPISASALPLPSNAAQETGGNLAAIATSVSTVATAQGVSGTGISFPTGASGILGWLSGIYNKVSGTLNIQASTLPLPTGAALETGGNLATIASNTSTTATNVASTNTALGTLNTTASSIATNTSNTVTQTTAAASALGTTADVAYSGSGSGSVVAILKKLSSELSGTLNTRYLTSGTDSVAITATSLPLPTGAALETGGNLASVATSNTAISTASGTTADTAYAGSGSASIIAALKGIYNIANNQGTAATGVTMPTGGVAALGWLSSIYNKLNTSIAVTGTFWQATQPVSVASLPLPTGAALETGGNLATTATNTGTISTTVSSINTATGTTADAAYAGSGSASVIAGIKGVYAAVKGSLNIRALTSADTVTIVPSGTQTVTATSLPLPTGAALESGNLSTTATNTTAISTATGTTADTAWTGTGNSSSIAALKAIYLGVKGTLNTRVLASGTDSVTTVPSGTQAVSVASLPLPTGAAVETGGNLASIATTNTTIATGVGTIADTAYAGSGSASIIAALKGIYTVSAAPTATQPVSIASLPALATGANVIGAVTQSGTWANNSTIYLGGSVVNASNPLPVTLEAGGNNAAAGTTGSAVPSNAGYTGWNSGGNLVGVAMAAALPVQPGTGATFPVSGTFWQATQPVSIASMPSTPVTGTFWQATQPVSGTVAATQSGVWSASGQATTNAPLYTTGTANPLSLTLAGALRVDGSATTQPVSIASMPSTPVTGTFWQATQPVSGTVTVGSLPALPAGANAIGSVTVSNFPGTQTVSGTVAATQSGTWSVAGQATTSAPTYTTGTANPLSLNLSGGLRVDGSGVTQPVSGTVAVSTLPALPTGANTIGSIANTSFIATQATAANLNATVVGTGTFAVQVSSALPTGSNSIGQVTANAGTNLNTSLLALESGGNLASIASSNTTIATNTGATNTVIGTTADAAYSGSGSASAIASLKGIYSAVKGSLNIRALTSADVVTTISSGTTAVSVASLPLPSGAAQETGNLATVATETTAIAGAAGTTADTAYAGTGSASLVALLKGVYNAVKGTINTRTLASGTDSVTIVPSGTTAISAVSLPLPTGAALETGGNLAATATNTFNSATATGSITDIAWTGTGSASIIAALKAIYNVSSVATPTQPVSGTVAISSLPALGTGSNTIGAVTQSGTWTSNSTIYLGGTVVSGANPIPVTVSGGGSNAAAGSTGSVVPTSGDYTAWNSGGNLTGVSLTTALPIQPGTGASFPVTGTFWQATQPVSIATMPTTAVTGTFWQSIQPVSGTVSANQSGTWTFDGQATTSAPTYTTGTANPLSLNLSGGLRVDGSGVTQPVSLTTLPALATGSNAIGSITNTTFAATQATASALNATVVGTGTFAVQNTASIPAGANAIGSVTVTSLPAIPTGANTIGAVNQGGSWTVTANNSTPANLQVMNYAAATTAAPTYTTGTNNALSLNLSGGLRVDGSGVTQPVSIATMPTTPVTGTFWQATQPVSLTTLPALATGSNAIGSITNTSFIATQSTASNLNATVVGTGTFAVQNTAAIPAGGNAIGTVGVTSVVGVGATAAAVPSSAGYVAWNSGGNLTGVALANALPIQPGTGATFTVSNAGTFAVQNTAAIPAGSNAIGSVTVSNFPGTQAVSGTVTSNQGTAAAIANAWPTKLTDGTNSVTVTPLTNSTALTVKIVDGTGSQITSFGGSSSNAAAGSTGSSVPASASYTAWNSGGNLTGISLTTALPIQPGTGASFPVTGTFWQATQPVSIASMPSTPVTGTFWQATQPVSGTIAATQSGTWSVSGQATTSAPTYSTGTANPLSLNLSGGLRVDGSGVTQPVSIASMPSTPVTGTFWQSTQPVSLASLPSLPTGANSIGQVTANAGTNLNTSALALESGGNLASINTKIPSLGQALAAASVPVVLTAAQITTLTPPTTVGLNAGSNAIGSITNTTFASTQSGTWNTGRTWTLASGTDSVTMVPSGTQTVTGTITANNSVAGNLLTLGYGAVTTASPVYTNATNNALSLTTAGALRVDATGTTQPVSIASMPSTPVTGTFWQATQPVSGTVTVGSLPALPSGANTIGSIANTSFAATQSGTWNIGTITTLPALATGTNSIGQVTANAGTNLNTSLLALESGGNLASIASSNTAMSNASGTTADAAYAGTGNTTIIGALKGIYNKSGGGGGGSNAAAGTVGTTAPTSASNTAFTDSTTGNLDVVTQLNGLPISINGANFIFSSNNSSTAQLAAGATFTGIIETALNQPDISMLITSDQNLTVTINQYIDSGGVYNTTPIVFTVLAGVGFSESFPINANYINVTAKNIGTATTTTFNLNVAYGNIGAADSSGNLPVSIKNGNVTVTSATLASYHTDAFNQMAIAERQNDFQCAFIGNGSLSTLCNQTYTGSATGTWLNGQALFTTGTTNPSTVVVSSIGTVNYTAGAEVYAEFTAVWYNNIAGTFQRIGFTDTQTNGFFIGYEGTVMSVSLMTGGVITIVTPQSSWNVDTLTGSLTSNFTRNGVPEAINWSYQNIFRIRFGWLGSASIFYEVYSPDGKWITFHINRNPNTQNVPHIQNPNMPISVWMSGNGTALTMGTSCWAAGSSSPYGNVSGSITPNSPALTVQGVNFSRTPTGQYVNNLVDSTGATVVSNTTTLGVKELQQAQSQDNPVFTAITGDPTGDYAGVNLIEGLLDPNSGLAMSNYQINIEKRDVNNSIILSDAPFTGNNRIYGAIGNRLIIDTTGYSTLSISMIQMAGGIYGTNDLSGSWSAVNAFTLAGAISTTLSANTNYIVPCITRYLSIVVTTAGSATYYLRSQQLPSGYLTTPAANITQIAGTATIGGGIPVAGSAASNGMTLGTQITAATPAILVIKTGAGRLYNISVGNVNTSAVYLKIFNATTATLGTTSANLNYYIPASNTSNIVITDAGLYFSTGITVAVTGAISLTDNTAITSGTALNYAYI